MNVDARARQRAAGLSAPHVLLVLTACCGSLLSGRASAQELDQQLQALVAQAETATVARLYELGDEAADLAPDRNPDRLRDAVVRLAGRGATSDRVRVFGALTLRQLKNDDTYGKDVFDLLQPVAASTDAGLLAATMAMLGDERSFNARMLPDVRKLVLASCQDELAPALVRIEAAVALWRVGVGEKERGTAKTTLEQFLQSNDRELRQRGALALAELNVEGGPAWAVLREMQNEPTDLGRRAQLYLKRAEERREFEQMIARVVQRNAGSDTGREDDQYRVLDELRARIRAQHIQGSTFTDKELVEYAAKGMLLGTDQHSAYFTSDEFQRFFFELNREYGGIGAFVNFDQDGDFSIVRPIYSGPAYKAGLKSGDKILEVDGWETAGHTTDEIISRLKGRPETPVVLKWFRAGLQEPQEISIVRQQISVPAVNSAMIPGDIGYIELINFSSNISEELHAALAELTARGAKGIVLDVRNNTGGLLTQARDVVETFVPGEKLVVYTEGPSEPRRAYSTRDRAVCDLPLTVLTNRFSASASEITAGALQDHGRAVVIGTRSYGKGSVQNLLPLRSDKAEDFEDLNDDGIWEEGEPYTDRNKNGKFDVGAHIKLTVAKYYLPSGRCPHREYDKEGRIVDPHWGVRPDKEIELLENKPEDAWKNSVVVGLLKKNVFREYVHQQLPKNPDLFRQLAEGDDGDASRYPDFDKFYEGLNTGLSKDDVRRWLRYEVRDQISDLRGAVYPGQRLLGDPQEDAQLQEAVQTILTQLGKDIRDVPAYAKVLKIKFDEKKAAAK